MKILHTGDWHLCSPMDSKLTTEKAKQRRDELRSRFADMIRYAEENGVDAVLLCGDLSDDGILPHELQDYLLSLIENAADIRFFLVSGNHDPMTSASRGGCFSHGRRVLPQNLHIFEGAWETCMLDGGVTVSGTVLPQEMCEAEVPLFAADCFNIVMLHGQITDSGSRFGGEEYLIPLPAFRDRNIDYLALGHEHRFRHKRLDDRCTWCYAGCPEGRGFDECGPRGFVVLTVADGCARGAEFVPFAARILHDLQLDISDLAPDTFATEQALAVLVSQISPRDLVRITLVGTDAANCDRGLSYLRRRLAERFFYAELCDLRRCAVNMDALCADVSLRGEFVRQVLACETLSEEDRAEILRLGLAALSGEEGTRDENGL